MGADRVGRHDESMAGVARAIGRRVRTARDDLGWTLDELAARSGVSRRTLVQVEQGATNPSIGTLLRLSDALGVGLPALVEAGQDAGGSVVVRRHGAGSPMWTSEAGGSAVLVAGTAPPDVSELWDWRLGPGDDYRSEAHKDGTRELIHVLSGTVVLVVAGTEHRLVAGDAAAFDADASHSYRNGSDSRPARFSLAVHEPGVSTEVRR